MTDNSSMSGSADDRHFDPSAIAERVAGQALYVLAGNLFTLVVGFPLQILISRVLGAQGLGSFSLLEGASATIAGLFGLGLAQTAVRFIPQFKEEGSYSAIRKFLVRGGAVLGVAGIVGYVCFVFFATAVVGWSSAMAGTAAVLLMGLTIPLGLLSYFSQQALRGFQDIRHLIIGSSFLQLTVKAVVIIASFALGVRLLGVVVASVVSLFAALLWQTARLRRHVGEVTARSASGSDRDWRRFAAISFANSLVGLPASYLDRFLLGYVAGASAVGVLAVTRQLQMLPMVIFQMLLSVSSPMFAAAHTRNDSAEREHLYGLVTDWAVTAALPLTVFLSFLAYPVLSLFGRDFADLGALPVRILMLAQLINLASGPTGNMAMMSGLERQVFKVHAATTAGTALSFCVFIPLFGLVGVALSFLLTAIASNIWMLAVLRHRLKLRWWNRRYLRWLVPGLLTAGLAALLRALVGAWDAAELILALLGLYAVFGVACVAQGLNDDDRTFIKLLKSRLQWASSPAL